MKVKVIKASTMKEAMDEVKNVLGEHAVILHTKKYREGGFMGYKSKEIVEVTAAIDEQDTVVLPRIKDRPLVDRSIKSNEKKLDNKSIIVPANMLDRYATNGTRRGLEIAATSLKKQSSREKKAISDKYQGLPQEKNSVLPVKEHQTKPTQMQSLLDKMNLNEKTKSVVTIRDRLIFQEVPIFIVQELESELPYGAMEWDSLSLKSLKSVSRYIDKIVNFSGGANFRTSGKSIITLVGPTGVGKTTTLAKIAAHLVLETDSKVGVITADTYRISAVEQLKTYTEILGLPLDVVYSTEELALAISRHKDKDVILIDTAGRSQLNKEQMQELKSLLAADARINNYLVLSATTNTRDMNEIFDKFSICGIKGVIFTKLDETSAVGSMLGFLVKKNVVLSYLTNGQSVPDDIIPAQAESFTSILLGKKKRDLEDESFKPLDTYLADISDGSSFKEDEAVSNIKEGSSIDNDTYGKQLVKTSSLIGVDKTVAEKAHLADTFARVVLVTSGKKGEGKTSLAVNLAIALSQGGARVGLMDLAQDGENIQKLLKIASAPQLVELLDANVDVEDLLIETVSNVSYIAGATYLRSALDIEHQKRQSLREKLIQLDKMFDYIIIDAEAGLNKGVRELALAADYVLLMTTPESAALMDAYAVMKAYSKYADDSNNIRLVVNNVSDEKNAHEVVAKLQGMSKKFLQTSVECIGFVPSDTDISKMIFTESMLEVKDSKAVQAIKNIVISLTADLSLVGIKGWRNFINKFLLA